MAKIYTKIGDQGKTQLIDGSKVKKSSRQIEAYGTLDELNAYVGLLRDKLVLQSGGKHLEDERFQVTRKQLAIIQRELFELGCELAHPEPKVNQRAEEKVGPRAIKRLETEIDAYTKELPPLTNFILPGGHPLISYAHLARTVCRRGERLVVGCCEDFSIRSEVLVYLNRLSDWFFTVGRFLAKKLEVEENIWT